MKNVDANTEVNILTFVANGFGDSYYINKGIMESYNWTITTASSSTFVIGCKNNDKNVTDTYSDILVDTISDKDISNYDCVFVPSGEHWSNVIAVSRILEIIKNAHESEILVAGICTGMIVLANADILEGVKVAFNYHAAAWMSAAGANMTGDPVVSDQGIITGGFGGGVGQGPENAPNELFCEKIMEEINLRTETEKTSYSVGLLVIGIISIPIILQMFRRKEDLV